MASNEWLARFRDDLENALDAPTRGDIRMLLREYDRLRAEYAALMEIATWASRQKPYVEESTYEKAHCPGCGASFGVLGEIDWNEEVAELQHRPGCPVVKAQALVSDKNVSSINGD